MKYSLALLGLLTTCHTTVCSAQNPTVTAPSPRLGTLFQADFETETGWPGAKPSAVGTINVAASTQLSGGLSSASMLSSGPVALGNTETNLGKLTLAFDLSASAARPVTVRVESFDKAKKRTGGIETQIYPAAPDFYQRYALDLMNFKPSGAGKFAPNAPFVAFSMALGSANWKGVAKPEIRLDNVHFAKPAFYVSASGSDKNDGRTEKTAFARPQKAVDLAQAGDIIAVMNGTYLPNGIQEGIVRFKRAGAASGWISLKSYPGHNPMFSIEGTWEGIRFRRNAAEAEAEANKSATLAYIEVRGMHIRGGGDVVREKYAQLIGQVAPETNGSGIGVGWSSGPDIVVPHHLRFADNLVEYCPGGGIGPGRADWVTVENNTIRNNCWTTIYANSGVSMNQGSNFDGTSGGYRVLIRNNEVSGNRTFEKWRQIGKVSDGNGIIIDINQESKLPLEQRFNGRTLIAGNLCFNNGGSGIHAYKSKRVDIINNTLYLNAASPELVWGQLFVQNCDDVKMINNIVVAREGEPVNTSGMKYGDQGSKNILRAGNIYFGGGAAPIMGEGDIIADPQFVNASIDEKFADFRLKTGSPALKTGAIETFNTPIDLAGNPRGATPNIGAYAK